MNQMHVQTLLASKARRVVDAYDTLAGVRTVIELAKRLGVAFKVRGLPKSMRAIPPAEPGYPVAVSDRLADLQRQVEDRVRSGEPAAGLGPASATDREVTLP